MDRAKWILTARARLSAPLGPALPARGLWIAGIGLGVVTIAASLLEGPVNSIAPHTAPGRGERPKTGQPTGRHGLSNSIAGTGNRDTRHDRHRPAHASRNRCARRMLAGRACKASILAEAETDGPILTRLDPYTVIACEECETPEAGGDRPGPPVRPARRDGS